MNKPSFYSILTADVRYSKELTDFEKLLFSEISALTHKDGYCTASNAWLAELYCKHPMTISKAISNLEKKGFLKIEIVRNDKKEVEYRKIYLQINADTPISKNADTPISKNADTPISKNADTYKQKRQREYYKNNQYKNNHIPLTPADDSHCDAGAPLVAAGATTAQQDSVALQTKPKRNSKADQVPCNELLEAYNEILGGMLPKAQLLTKTRKQRFVSRWLEIIGTTAPNGKTRYKGRDDGLIWWRSLFAKVKLNPFWVGENDSGWCADLDWILKPANFVKILEWKPAKR